METKQLAQLIDERFAVLVDLRQLAQRQRELIGAGDMTRLLSLLAVKQQRLNDLQLLETRLDAFRGQDPEQRVWHSLAERQRCREAAQQSEALLADIMSAERHCETILVQRRDHTAQLLQDCHRAAHATQAYGESLVVPGSQFDMSCES